MTGRPSTWPARVRAPRPAAPCGRSLRVCSILATKISSGCAPLCSDLCCADAVVLCFLLRVYAAALLSKSEPLLLLSFVCASKVAFKHPIPFSGVFSANVARSPTFPVLHSLLICFCCPKRQNEKMVWHRVASVDTAQHIHNLWWSGENPDYIDTVDEAASHTLLAHSAIILISAGVLSALAMPPEECGFGLE